MKNRSQFKNILFFLCFFLCIIVAKAQESNHTDSTQIYMKSLNALVGKARKLQTNTAYYSEELVNDSIDWYENTYRKIMNKIQNNDSLQLKLMLALTKIHKYTKKRDLYLDSLKFYVKKNKNSVYTVFAYRELAANQALYGNYTTSINYYNKAIEIAKKQNDYGNLRYLYLMLGGTYDRLRKDSLAIEMYKTAEFYDTKNPNKGVNNHIVNKSIYLHHLTLKEAEVYAKEAIPVFKKDYNAYWSNLYLGQIHTILGDLYLKDGQDQKALELYKQAYKENSFRGKRNYVDLHFANYYAKQQKYEQAKFHFERHHNAFSNPEQAFKYRYILFDSNQLARDIYLNTKEYSKMIQFYDALIEEKERMILDKEKGLLEEFAVKFQVEQKETALAVAGLEIEKAQKNKVLLISSFTVVALILLASFLFYQKKRKYKLALLQQDLKLKNHRTQFFENVFHEIRTPMTIIGGYLNLIHKNTLKPNLVSKYSEIGIRNCQEITSSSNDFLALIKSEKSQQEICITQQSLVDFITKLLLKYKGNMSLKKISLIYNSNIEKGLELSMDYDKVEKILNNLMMNAIKYSPENTQITFSSQIENQTLIFKVQDQGYGIPENEQKYIFERFYQASSNKVISGVGIGLSLVKNFVTLLGGSIDVKSRLREGSLFTISLPVDLENVSDFVKGDTASLLMTLEESSEVKKKAIENLPKLLLVEDNYEMTQYIKELLGPYYDVDISLSPVTALKRLKKQSYQIIVSDFRMPEMDGLEFKETLNETPHKDIPFIMVTASTLPENKKKSLALGINDYLVKPFQDVELITRIKVLLGNKELQLQYLKETVLDKEENISKINFDSVVKLANEIITKNLSDEAFSVSQLAEKCNYSTRQFTRIMKKSTGLSPNKLILEVRLLTAYEIIASNKEKRIKQVMFDVGISSYGYFNKAFTERFGLKPSELINSK